jgi:tetratricopeptide (TPR) repeat protein
MKLGRATLSFLVFFALLAGIGVVWRIGGGSDAPQDIVVEEGPVPLPPVPPRIAEGGDYDKCLGMIADDPQGAANFSDAWQANGGGDPAIHCQALALEALGEPEKTANILETLATSGRGTALTRATIFSQAAEARMVADDPKRAFEDDARALDLDPGNPDMLLDRAVAAMLLDRNQNAIDDATSALDADPRRADGYTLRGTAWRRVERWELARDDIDRALLIDPDLPDALLERGILRQHARDNRGARADWVRVTQLSPNTPLADLAEQNLDLLEAGPGR